MQVYFIFPFFLFLIALFIVWIFSEQVITLTVKAASAFKVTTLFIGFLFIGLAMALPEVVISLISGFNEVPEVAFGNILGASFNNMSLILGIVGLWGVSEKIEKDHVKNLLLVLLFIFLLMAFVLFCAPLTKWHGVILLLGYLLSAFWIWLKRKSFTAQDSSCEGIEIDNLNGGPLKESKTKILWKLFFSILVILIAAEVAVEHSSFVAHFLRLSLPVFGGIVFALITTVPEFFLAINAARKRCHIIALSSMLGSILPHLCLCTALLTFISPAPIQIEGLRAFLIFSFAAIIVLAWALFRKRRINGVDGSFLIGIFLLSLFYHLFF